MGQVIVLKALKFIKKNIVFCIAAMAAFVTCFLVPPDRAYIDYFDFKTLSCLFITLAVVCALRNIKFFTILARKLVAIAGNLRSLFLLLIVITFIGSMIIANDMALITFLPLGYFALSVTKQEKYSAYLFVLQNISANLGGMLTPFGNPQNLYLYSYFNIPTGEFCKIMLPSFLVAILLLVLFCIPVKSVKFTLDNDFAEKLNIKKTILYGALFLLSVLIVFRVIPFMAGLIVIPAILFIADKNSLKMVDYSLLGTFFFFFIFAGNLSRLSAVNEIISSLLEKDTLLVSVISCQFISNVPTAILLSKFTENFAPLLLGVNIGGTGTLIASLASLITFSEFKLLYPGQTKKYLFIFAFLNGVFLIILTVFAKVFTN
ncbi:MAG: citrate transporter [Clostridia bacterium]|nr:citrate transporter [Clostridia bacterium]